jgi:hypothetical protein
MMALIDRLRASDIKFLKSKLDEKAVDDVDRDGVLNKHLVLSDMDADKAFSKAFPVGLKSPDDVNPGMIYNCLREKEPPSKSKKEADILAGQGTKIAMELGKMSMDLLKDMEQKASKMQNEDKKTARLRSSVIAMARDFPRALMSLTSSIGTWKTQSELKKLKRARFILNRVNSDWTAVSIKVQETPLTPVDGWFARIKDVQSLAEEIRKCL